jgi:hypothetical protein
MTPPSSRAPDQLWALGGQWRLKARGFARVFWFAYERFFLYAAQRFFIISDNRSLPAAVIRCRRRRFGAAFPLATGAEPPSAAMARSTRSRSLFNSETIL